MITMKDGTNEYDFIKGRLKINRIVKVKIIRKKFELQLGF